MFLRELFETRVLLETTKGGAQVLNNKHVIPDLAAMLKMDHTLPVEERMKLRKMDDNAIAKWFVEKMEAVENIGYNGIRFSRDGQYIPWLANNYAKGTDVWEDLEDVFPMAMTDWVALKNRNRLDPKHQDIQQFKGVKMLAMYMSTHYRGELDDIRDRAKKAAQQKIWRDSARSIKVVDEPEYAVYLLQNRSAAIMFGMDSNYCTANTNNDSRWHLHSNTSPLFGLVPKLLPRLADPRNPMREPNIIQKFQFDAADGDAAEFMNHVNYPADPAFIKEHFPYLFTDLVAGLKANANEIENRPEEDEVDDRGNPIELKVYKVGHTIDQLKNRFAKYWTDEKRPTPVEPVDGEENPPPPAAPQA